MRGPGRGLSGVFAALFPEKRIFIQTADHTRYIRLSPGLQIGAVAAILLSVGWLAVATASLAIQLVAADGQADRAVVLEDAYRSRLDALAEERDRRAGEALSAQSRFQTAMDQIGRQQTALLRSLEERRELEAALETTRARLAEVGAERDTAADANDRLIARMEAAASPPGQASSEDLSRTLRTITGALTEAVEARDAATAAREALAAELAATERRLAGAARRHEEMLDEVEQAVEAASAPLEDLIERADLDLDGVLATMRADYSGQGGPLVPVAVSSRSFSLPAPNTRFDDLMIDIDRMNLLRIAVGKVPFAMPLDARHRFTSGFGMRRDPKGRGRRMHTGADFAAPKGTPILATADGVVTSAGSESGYGKTVRIEHALGFETVYAHLNRLLVESGQQVSRGTHIGDMGTTGRSTGVHLHYEVRLDGRPVNPMAYVEAAKDVFQD